ncbi:MAG: MBL fold metallo-hydrolase [Spirochaetia bacterium]
MRKLLLLGTFLLISTEFLFSAGIEVHFIDVGHGEAVLVDAGENGAAYDYLAEAGIESIDLAVATHGHADHIGGFTDIFEHIPVESVWYNGQSHTTLAFEGFIDGVIDSGAQYYEPVEGDTLTFTHDTPAAAPDNAAEDSREAEPGNFIPLSIEVLHPGSSAGEYEGHLHREVLARVEEHLEAPVYGTDTLGTVVLYYDGGDTLEVRY